MNLSVSATTYFLTGLFVKHIKGEGVFRMYLGHFFKMASTAGAGMFVEFEGIESGLVLFFAMLAMLSVLRMMTVKFVKNADWK